MRILSLALVLAALSLPASAQDPADKAPVPDADALKEAEKLIREVFAEDFAKSSPADRRDLARKLLEQGLQTKDNPAVRYELFDEAKDAATQAEEPDLAMAAIDEMDRRYRIDARTMKSGVLTTLGRTAKTPVEQIGLAEAWLALALQAVQADDFETAGKAATSAVSFAKRSKDASLLAKAEAQAKEVSDRRNRYEGYSKAKEKLASDPKDPAANLAVGRFLCLIKNRWADGLPFLAKGSDPALKSAAAKDIASAVDPSEQVAVGDAWWDLAEKQPDVEKWSLRSRAAYWYRLAMPALTGLNRVRVRKRLVEVRAVEDMEKTWVTLDDPAVFGLPGKAGEGFLLTATANDTRRAMAVMLPEWSFDAVSVRVNLESDKEGKERKENKDVSAGLIFEGGNRCAYVSTVGSKSAKEISFVLNHLDKQWVIDFQSKLVRRGSHTITVVNGEGEYVVYVDGTEMTRLENPSGRLAPFGVEVTHSPVIFDKVQLRRLP